MLSIKQEAVKELMLASQELIQLASRNWPNKSLEGYTVSFVHAVSRFGESEHYARQAERSSLLGVQKDREIYASKMVKVINEDGLQLMADAGKTLPTVINTSNDISRPLSSQQKKELEDFKRIFADILVDSQIKPNDAKIIQDKVVEITNLAIREDTTALAKQLEESHKDLIKLRNRDDRGAIDNIPAWKLVAVAGALGIAVIGVIHCSQFGCRGQEGAYIAATVVLSLIALFC